MSQENQNESLVCLFCGKPKNISLKDKEDLSLEALKPCDECKAKNPTSIYVVPVTKEGKYGEKFGLMPEEGAIQLFNRTIEELLVKKSNVMEHRVILLPQEQFNEMETTNE